MKYPVTILILTLFAVCVHADDIKTLSGKKLTGVSVNRVEPDGVVVMTSDGIEKIPFSDLSPELQKKYGYDPQKAAAYALALQKQAEVKAQQIATQARQQAEEARRAEARAQQEAEARGAEAKAQQEAEARGAEAKAQQAAANHAVLTQKSQEQHVSETGEFFIQISSVAPGGVIAHTYPVERGSRLYELLGNPEYGITIWIKGLTGVAEGETIGIQAYRDGRAIFENRTLQNWVFVKRVKDPKRF